MEDRLVMYKLEVFRDEWIDLSNYLDQATVKLADIDDRVSTLSFSLRNDSQAGSFRPRDTQSPWNVVGSEYKPLLWPQRRIRLSVTTSPLSDQSQATTRPLFDGLLGDKIAASGSLVSCEARDMAKLLQDCFIEEERVYGSEAGTPAEAVIQGIIDDNLGPGKVSLYCPVSPGFMLWPYQVEYKSVWDAIQEIAEQIGWWLGYRYDPGTNLFRLTLLEPPRLKQTVDHVLTGDDVYNEELELNDADIRNAVKVTFKDSASGKRRSIIVEDEDSISMYGRRAMQVEEADTSLIDTMEEAENFAGAMLLDLKDLPSTNVLDLPIKPELDIFNTIQVQATYDVPEFYAVEAVTHSISADRMRTEVICAGRVRGAHSIWLEKQARPGAKEPLKEEDIGPIDKIENKPIEIVDPSSGLKYSMDQWGFVAVDINTEEVRPYVNRIAMGEASDGDFISLDFERTPQVKVVPRGLTTYNPDYSTDKQTLQVFASDISPEGFKVNCKLIVPGLETIHGQGDNLRNVGDYWISPYTYPNTTSFLVSIQAWFRYDIWNRMWNSVYFTYRLETQLLGSSIWEMVGEWTIGSREFNNNWFQTRVFVGAKTATHQWDTSGGQKRIKLTMVDRYSNDPGTGTIYWNEMYVRVNSWREVSDFVTDTGDVSWLAIEGGGGDNG